MQNPSYKTTSREGDYSKICRLMDSRNRQSVHTPLIYRTSNHRQVGNIENQERSVCFICAADHPTLWAVSECSHRVCSICSLRMRSLYGSKRCAWCKTESEKVVVVKAKVESDGGVHIKAFEELWSSSLPSHEQMYFMDGAIQIEALKVLKVCCPVPKCREGKKEWSGNQDLKRHVSSAHDLLFCDICLSYKKAFPFEYKYYTRAELVQHQKVGDVGRTTGHPACILCGILFYSDDELNEHYRDNHENCFICQRQRGGKPSYYRNYEALVLHFRNSHFLCPEPMCLELKFVVFENELEYKTHMAEIHLAHTKMQRSAQKQFRRIDANFSYGATPKQDGRRGVGQPSMVSNESSVLNASPPPPPIEPLPQSMAEKLIFGDAIGDLARRLQSLTMYEQRNVDLCESLKHNHHLTEGNLDNLKRYCRQYQKGELGASDLTLRLESLIGNASLKQVAPVLLELELDTYKRMQLENSVKLHLRKIAEFPPLQTTVSGIPNTSTNTILRKNTGKERSTPTATLRITPAGNRVGPGKTNRGIADPSRNPLTLLGAVKSAGSLSSSQSTNPKHKSKKPVPPSFQQAIATSSLVGIVRESQDRNIPTLDETDFPALTPTGSTLAPNPSSSSRGNVFAQNFNANEPELFLIGDNEKSRTFEDQKDELISRIDERVSPKPSTSRKKKGAVLMRYG